MTNQTDELLQKKATEYAVLHDLNETAQIVAMQTKSVAIESAHKLAEVRKALLHTVGSNIRIRVWRVDVGKVLVVQWHESDWQSVQVVRLEDAS